MDFVNILKHSGYTVKEANIYLHLLKNGRAPLSIIAKKTSMARSTVYSIAQKLATKGLVAINQNNKIQYLSPVGPTTLVENLQIEVDKKTQTMHELKKAIVSLAINDNADPIESILAFEGRNGLAQIMKDFKACKEQKVAIVPKNINVNLSLKEGFCDKNTHIILNTKSNVIILFYNRDCIALISNEQSVKKGAVIRSEFVKNNILNVISCVFGPCLCNDFDSPLSVL